MKKAGIYFVIYPLLYYACKQNGSSTTTNDGGKNDTTHFFQVTQYIQSQIAEVNKTPYYIYKVDITDGKRDSTAINTSVFNRISERFLKPDINDKNIKKYYTESIFHDQTTKSFTISYTTNDKQLEIQNIEILLREDGQTVKRVFIRNFFDYTDSSAIEQLSWRPGESFQINRLIQKAGNKENSCQTDVVWNEKN